MARLFAGLLPHIVFCKSTLKVTFRNVPSHQELDGTALHEDGEEDHGEGGGQEELLVPAGVVEDRRQGKPNCPSFFSRSKVSPKKSESKITPNLSPP